MKQGHELYPGWFIRVHSNNSIRADLKCEIECLTDDSGNLYDSADFCNIESVHGNRNIDSIKVDWNGNYMTGTVCIPIALTSYFSISIWR